MTRAVERLDVNLPAAFEEGRTYPFSIVGDWVALSGATDRECRIYWILRAHVNRKRELEKKDSTAWPAQPTIAELIGVKKSDTVGKAIKALERLGAIDVRTEPTPTGRQNVYTVHLAPPPGYEGLQSLDQYYEERKAAERAEQLAKRAAAASDNCRSDNISRFQGVPPENGIPPENGARVPPENGRRVPPENGVELDEAQLDEGKERRSGSAAQEAAGPGATPGAPPPRSPLVLDPEDPDTWLCKRHLADPPDPGEWQASCGPCGRVRKSQERKQASRVAAEEAEAAHARADAEVLRACWRCDADGHVWVRGLVVTPKQPCDHVKDPEVVLAEVRAKEDAQERARTGQVAPVVEAAAGSSRGREQARRAAAAAAKRSQARKSAGVSK